MNLTKTEKIQIAKVVLAKIFAYPEASNGVDVKTALLIGRDHGLNKGEMKQARKELKIISENRNGIQFWRMPGCQEGKKRDE